MNLLPITDAGCKNFVLLRLQHLNSRLHSKPLVANTRFQRQEVPTVTGVINILKLVSNSLRPTISSVSLNINDSIANSSTKCKSMINGLNKFIGCELLRKYDRKVAKLLVPVRKVKYWSYGW